LKADLPRLLHIRDAIDDSISFTADGKEFFLEDRKTQLAVVRCLEVIGEAVSALSNVTKVLCPDVPWADIVGTRNILIHEYFGVNLETVWAIVEDDIPALKEAVAGLIKRLS
jgi:uncharacterized protein with HEPN domain